MRLRVLTGAVALAGAVAVLLSGRGWWAFWPTTLGVALLSAPARRRYWSRIERNDPASVPLQAMWVIATWILLALFLGATQFAGLWFRQSTGKGLGCLAAAVAFGVGWWQAHSYRKRLLRNGGSAQRRSGGS